jgi:hypothetical protein
LLVIEFYNRFLLQTALDQVKHQLENDLHIKVK